MIVVLLAIVLVQTCVIIVLRDGVAFWRASYDSASLRGERRARRRERQRPFYLADDSPPAGIYVLPGQAPEPPPGESP